MHLLLLRYSQDEFPKAAILKPEESECTTDIRQQVANLEAEFLATEHILTF
jgi:hypothetical protein